MITFIVEGEPVGKARPRFTTKGTCYTPSKTVAYEQLVQIAFKKQLGNKEWNKNGAFAMSITASFKKAKTNKMSHPLKKPDLDNVIKAICDALNGVAYNDDCQICSIGITKYFSMYPQIEVSIKQVSDNECVSTHTEIW